MACKYIYIGQKWTSSDLKIGKGSIYLSGPRNRRGKSWRVDAINKIANAVEATLLIPEGANQLKGGFCRVDKEEKNRVAKVRDRLSSRHRLLVSKGRRRRSGSD